MESRNVIDGFPKMSEVEEGVVGAGEDGMGVDGPETGRSRAGVTLILSDDLGGGRYPEIADLVSLICPSSTVVTAASSGRFLLFETHKVITHIFGGGDMRNVLSGSELACLVDVLKLHNVLAPVLQYHQPAIFLFFFASPMFPKFLDTSLNIFVYPPLT